MDKTEAVQHRLVFTSQGSEIHATLFLPGTGSKHPVVILCHGTAAQKEFGLQLIAEDLARRGLAALAIDYRGFGQSETIRGKPRWYLSPRHHLDDILSAVEFARQHQYVDPDRIAIWGESMGASLAMLAAHTLELAGRPVQAVYAQCPALFEPPKWPWPFVRYSVLSAVTDVLTKNRSIKAYQETPTDTNCLLPDSFCFWPIIPDQTVGGWNNRIPARSLLSVVFFALSCRFRTKIKHMRTPTLLAQGQWDRFLGSSIQAVQDFFDTYPNPAFTRITFPGEHVSALPMVNPARYERHRVGYTHRSNTFYPGVYESMLDTYVAFFKMHLQPMFLD